MALMAAERDGLRTRFRLWLGAELYDERFDDVHLAAFSAVERCAWGELPGMWNAAVRLRHLPMRWERFTATADGFARRWTSAHRPARAARLAPWAAAEPDTALAGARPAAMRPQVLLNAASAAQLATVPGIGRASAARIVAERTAHGPFASTDELSRVRGFTKATRDRAAPYLGVQPPSRSAALTRVDLDERDGPLTFPALVRVLLRTGLQRDEPVPGWPAPLASPTPAGLAARQLSALAADVGARPFWAPPRRADAPTIERATRAALRHDTVRARYFDERIGAVGVVRNAAYLDVLLELFATASERALIEVFFFTSAEGGPGDRLLDALVAARGRGVDVRLIIDTDLVEDVHGAARINDETLQRLRDTGLPFRLDWLGTTSHGKTVVVDSDRLVTGTHNWTTRAMYGLDETSLYVEAPDLAARAANRFEQLWASYDPDGRRRTVDLSLVRLPLPHERRALTAAGLNGSRDLLASATTPRGARRLAAEHGLDPDRLERLWRVLALMQQLQLPEPTAYALTLTPASTPAAVRRTSAGRLRTMLSALGPLPDPYKGAPIRIDAAEVARA
jgi:phosphatidylserine/phosphatidylglycerophosphate/cardiolipin synthase-like enzyme